MFIVISSVTHRLKLRPIRWTTSQFKQAASANAAPLQQVAGIIIKIHLPCEITSAIPVFVPAVLIHFNTIETYPGPTRGFAEIVRRHVGNKSIGKYLAGLWRQLGRWFFASVVYLLILGVNLHGIGVATNFWLRRDEPAFDRYGGKTRVINPIRNSEETYFRGHLP